MGVGVGVSGSDECLPWDGPGASPEPSGWRDGGGRPGQFRMVVVRDGVVSSMHEWGDQEQADELLARALRAVESDLAVAREPARVGDRRRRWFSFEWRRAQYHYAVQEFGEWGRGYSVSWAVGARAWG